tara:strand:+ start:25 stop:144 length:120 start_codon:yes stop_codon:yes gene_type:complete
LLLVEDLVDPEVQEDQVLVVAAVAVYEIYQIYVQLVLSL